jgi:2-hydroxy-6-oxonona-2,4-dienedioate hydrolase
MTSIQSPAGSYPGMPMGKTVMVGGAETWYCEQGSGPTVLLVHGGAMGAPRNLGSADWAGPMRLMSRSRVVAVDRIGQGFTGNPFSADHCTMQASVSHLIAFIETAGLPPVHLVGHSRGGYAATRAALERQDLVRSLTIVSSGTLSPGVATTDVALAAEDRSISRDAVLHAYRMWMFDASGVSLAAVDACAEATMTHKYRELLAMFDAGNLQARLVLPQLAREKRETLRWLEEGRLQRPANVMWGRNDRTADPRRGLALFQIIRRHERRAEFNMVSRAGHFPFVEHPAWFAGHVAAFVAKVEHDDF